MSFMAASLPSALSMEGKTASLAVPLKITAGLCCQSPSQPSLPIMPNGSEAQINKLPPGVLGDKPIWPVASDKAETSPRGVELGSGGRGPSNLSVVLRKENG